MQAFSLKDIIYPVFLKEGSGVKEEIRSMPGLYRFSSDEFLKEAEAIAASGVKSILVFGSSSKKNSFGTFAYSEENPVNITVKTLKKNHSELTVMTDVCLCAYTDHGHCGILKDGTKPEMDQGKTLNALAKTAVSHARAGADCVSPSAMVKGQVGAVREALDKEGFSHTRLMAYSAKFASSFYGPFRRAADSAPKKGDRSGYQLDFRDTEKALARVESDIKEGADIVMVKPALAYLDVIKEVKEKFNIKLAAYNVSGEYSMVKNGARAGLWEEWKMIDEIFAGIKRAGADILITYHALGIAKRIHE